MLADGSRSLYELAFRERDGVAVALLWHGITDTVLLSVRETRTGEWFLLAIDPSRALDAFRDPFAFVGRTAQRAPLPS